MDAFIRIVTQITIRNHPNKRSAMEFPKKNLTIIYVRDTHARPEPRACAAPHSVSLQEWLWEFPRKTPTRTYGLFLDKLATNKQLTR